VECSGEESSSAKGDAVSPPALDLGDKGMAPELSDEAADALAATTAFLEVEGWGGPEEGLEVVVGETVDEVCAREDGLEEVDVGASYGVETRELLTTLEARTAEGVELCDGLGVGPDLGEGIEIATVGGLTDLDVSPEVVDALSHGLPVAMTPSTPIVFEAKDLKSAGLRSPVLGRCLRPRNRTTSSAENARRA